MQPLYCFSLKHILQTKRDISDTIRPAGILAVTGKVVHHRNDTVPPTCKCGRFIAQLTTSNSFLGSSPFRCSFAPRPFSIYTKQKERKLDSTKRVLWADDDKEDIFLFSATLKELQANIDCHFLPNGKELISFIATSGAPKLIILDLNMPLMNGQETLKFLKSSDIYAHIPVVIFTTSHSLNYVP